MNKISIAKRDFNPLQTANLPLAVLLVLCSAMAAQAAVPAAPDAGSILQQMQPVMPPSPSPNGTGLTIERKGGQELPPSAPFMVKTIRISGNTRFDTATLHALVADEEGNSLSLSQLDKLVGRITDYYHSHGYPLAQAVIPAQAIRDGIVAVEVIEARYGNIALDNHSRVNDSLLRDVVSPLQSGQSIDETNLDHVLLLLSDIPGVAVSATLKPGESVATSDLLLDTTARPAISGNAMLDDYGDRYTGRERIGGTLNVINPLRHGDVLSLSGLSSGNGVNYGRIAYEFLLDGQGTRLGGSYSALHYIVGEPLASLNAHGTAQVKSLWAIQPLLRSRDVNLYGQIQYDRLQLSDNIGASAIQTNRHLHNWTANLTGNAQDAFLSGGINTLSASWTAGHVDFDNSAAQLADAATASTQGGFSKWTAKLSRLQSLSALDGLYLAVSGQWANANLDPSMKMIAGGPYSVRAYDSGAVSGDTGYQETAEFRHDLGTIWNGQWQAVAFIDSAHVTVNKDIWVMGTNSATLNGAGVGINWTGPNQWSAKSYIATPIGSAQELVANRASVRLGAEISGGF
jgi:hemolysin activation/secretion protein